MIYIDFRRFVNVKRRFVNVKRRFVNVKFLFSFFFYSYFFLFEKNSKRRKAKAYFILLESIRNCSQYCGMRTRYTKVVYNKIFMQEFSLSNNRNPSLDLKR